MKQRLALAANILNKAKLPKIPNEISTLQDESLHKNPNTVVIAKCISRNQKLLTRFLAVSSFVSKKEVGTAKQAVDILGVQGVFTLFFSNAIEYVFESADDSAEIINHSIKVAIALAELSSRLNIPKSDCYLFGLLHNVGYIVLSRYDSATYETHYLKSLLSPSSAYQREMETFGTSANCIGVYVAKKWRVKNSLYSAILLQGTDHQKIDDSDHNIYELIHLLNIARSVVAHTEDKRYVTEEIQSKSSESMTKLGITNMEFSRARATVVKMTQDLKSSQKNASRQN